jgi:hypothetical protein
MIKLSIGQKVQIIGYENTRTKGIGYVSYINKSKTRICISEGECNHATKPNKLNTFPIERINVLP